MPNSLKFVDAIAASPTTRLDVNIAPFYLKSFDAPPPRLRRASSSTMLVDGDVVSAAAYEPRTIHMSFEVLGTSDVTGLAIQQLARELDRPTNLLRWLPTGATNPVFFRVRRSDYSAIEERHNINGVRTVECDLLCEPFAYGLREDLSAVVISNDPLAGTNPMNALLGTVKGDVATPAFIYHLSGAYVGLTEMLGIDHGAATTGVPPVDQGEGNTYGTDMSGVAVGAASNGNVARLASTASGTLATRLSSMYIPATEPGVYRLMARMRQVTAVAASWRIRYIEVTGGATDVVGDTITFAGSTADWFMVDLGLFQFPVGSNLSENGLTGAPMGRDTAAVGALQIARDSGASALDIDFVMAVPAYGDLSFTLPNITSATHYVVFDGYSDTQSLLVSGTPLSAPLYYPGSILSRTGGLPQLWPNAVNRLWHIWNIGAVGTGHDITQTITLNVSYWPRYTYVRPLST